MMTWWEDLMLIPFKDGGRDRRGVDCFGLVRLAYQHYGIDDLPEYWVSCFDTVSVGNAINFGLNRWKEIEEPENPCIVVMATDAKSPNMINHLGLYIGGGHFLHAFKKIGVSRTSIKNEYFGKRIKGYYVPAK